MRYWLKALGGGAAGRQVRDDWRQETGGILQKHATFARRPNIKNGDGIVYYAVGTGLVFAGGTVTSPPYENATNQQNWPWRIDVHLDEAKDFIHEGVSLDRLNVPSGRNQIGLRIKRRSHVQLSAEEYAAAMAALRQ